jgi:hypothetical protein
MRLYNTKDKLKPDAQIFLMLDMQHMLYWIETKIIYDKEILDGFVTLEEHENFKLKLVNDINLCIKIVMDLNNTDKNEAISNKKNKNAMIKILKTNIDFLQDYFKFVKEEEIIEEDFRAWFEKKE